VLAAGGIALVLWPSHAKASEPSTAAGVEVVPGLGGAAIRGAF
jgi:hypothetical protein